MDYNYPLPVHTITGEQSVFGVESNKNSSDLVVLRYMLRQVRLREMLCAMHHDERVATKLRAGKIASFVRVNDADYEPIRAMYDRVQKA